MDINEALEIIWDKEESVTDQYTLAKVVGVSQGTISNYYNKKSEPTKDVAARIYHEYGLQCEPFTILALAKYAERYLND